MKTAWRVGLALAAALLVIAGAYYVTYGTTYYDVYYANQLGAPCLNACSYPGTGITVVFSGYTVWNPPTWENVNYSAPLCMPSTITTYTPQNPPPSCLYPPADKSADYTKTYGGVFLVILGVISGVAAVVGREPRQDASTSAAS